MENFGNSWLLEFLQKNEENGIRTKFYLSYYMFLFHAISLVSINIDEQKNQSLEITTHNLDQSRISPGCLGTE